MKNLIEFKNFSVNEEFSKNDPIPEITRHKDHLGIVLLGLPGSGKSTFANKFIIPHNSNIKTFSTDDVSFLYTKDKTKYYKAASELNIKYLHSYLRSGQNFVYDTTGSNDINVFEITKAAHKMGYKMLFILMLIDVDTAKKQNIKRGMTGGHMADEEYIDYVYSTQLGTTKSYLKYLKPDSFYVVLNKGGKYKYYKFHDGELRKRKVDKYIPFIKESVDIENEVDKIVDTMLNFIDEGEKITFKSSTGDMSYTDYLEKNNNYSNFKPIIVSKNKTVSVFTIVYHTKDGSYVNLMTILDNMQSTIGWLGDEGWVLSDFKTETQRGDYGKNVKITWVSFEFTKPDVSHGKFELPDEDELRLEIEGMGIGIENLEVEDSGVTLDFYSHSYDGELNSESYYDEKFEKICNIFGFTSFDLWYQKARVFFEY